MRGNEVGQQAFLEKIEAPPGAHLFPVVGGKKAIVRVVKRPGKIEADALIVKHRQFRLTMLPGDCPPIVLVDEESSMIALLHGSRDALERRVIQKTLRVWREEGADPDQTKAFVGPGIGVCCYWFPPSQERESWLRLWPKEYILESPSLFGGSYWAIDLQGFIREHLWREGIRTTLFSGVCTCCSQEEGGFSFPSHRRSKMLGNPESRFLAAAWLK